MDQQNEYTSNKAHRPPKDHPWRKMVSSDIKRWAGQESGIANVNSVYSARPDTLRRSTPVNNKKH